MKELSVIDLFAGAGGFGLGFKLAGYEIKVSLEKDAWAVNTLVENNLDAIILQDDIRIYDNLEDINKFLGLAPDIIIGGPPCQGFSVSGKAKDPSDPRNSLFM